MYNTAIRQRFVVVVVVYIARNAYLYVYVTHVAQKLKTVSPIFVCFLKHNLFKSKKAFVLNLKWSSYSFKMVFWPFEWKIMAYSWELAVLHQKRNYAIQLAVTPWLRICDIPWTMNSLTFEHSSIPLKADHWIYHFIIDTVFVSIEHLWTQMGL